MNDPYMPPARGAWSFSDPDVAKVFDKMLPLSIPDYHTMRWLTTSLAANVNSSEPVIADLGSSRGDAVAPLVEAFPEGKFHLWEQSAPMCDVLHQRFSDHKNVIVHREDLRIEPFVSNYFDCVLSVLTIMFVPVEYRVILFKRIYDSIKPGGRFLLVEKTLQSSDLSHKEFTSEYYSMKSRNGYSDEQIERKRLSLEGVLVPMTFRANVSNLQDAGFKSVECYWKALHFTGWIAYK